MNTSQVLYYFSIGMLTGASFAQMFKFLEYKHDEAKAYKRGLKDGIEKGGLLAKVAARQLHDTGDGMGGVFFKIDYYEEPK